MLLLEYCPTLDLYLANEIKDGKVVHEPTFIFRSEDEQLEFVEAFHANKHCAAYAYHARLENLVGYREGIFWYDMTQEGAL